MSNQSASWRTNFKFQDRVFGICDFEHCNLFGICNLEFVIYIIIPAYNEEASIGPLVRDIFSLDDGMRVIVVDDGSSDRTGELAKEAGATVLSHLVNRGQGAALKTGTDDALRQGAEIIVHFDADGQFDPRDIGRLVEPVRKGEVEVALGSRFLDKATVGAVPWSKRWVILPIARLVNFLFTGLWLTDAHNGFRALSRRAAELIEITQDRMAHNSEIVAQIKKHRLPFREVPVAVHYREYGQGAAGGLAIVKDLLLGKISKS